MSMSEVERQALREMVAEEGHNRQILVRGWCYRQPEGIEG